MTTVRQNGRSVDCASRVAEATNAVAATTNLKRALNFPLLQLLMFVAFYKTGPSKTRTPHI
jgi:hypothetical protein